MCGFLTVYSPDGGIEREKLAAGIATLHHRGPDSTEIWISPERRVGMAHARLSIIDLEGGTQPLANEDGTIHIVVNGEFYGFEAIRRELERQGHKFRTQSDSEIALHLYEQYGTQCLHRLRGEFAFVIWDERNQTLFAARDRFGIKPLFYSMIGNRLYFASEAKALFAAGVPARWDEETVLQMHSGRLSSPARSLFRGVEQLAPGHFLIATPDYQRVMRYWDFDYPLPDAPNLIRNGEEAIEAFRAKFNEAVNLRLRADVPVGCYLSGGLDSCSILGTASKLSSRPIHAFTIKFEAGDYDESVIAEEMATHAGAVYSPLEVNLKDLADNFGRAIWNGETPLWNAHAVAKFLLSRHARDQGFKVVLTGEGSDEILGGYVHFRRDWLLHNSSITDPVEQQRHLADMDSTNAVSKAMLTGGEGEDLVDVRNMLGFVPAFIQAGGSAGTKFSRLLRDDLKGRLRTWSPYRQFLNEIDIRGQLKGREPVHQSLYLWSKTMLPNYLLSVLGDRMEMAHSIEGRVPFLDHELVELTARIPVAEKIKGVRREKQLLREAAKPVLTDTVYRREKHPFLSPPAAASKDPALRDLIFDTLGSSGAADVPFFDRRGLSELLNEARSTTSGAEQAALDPALISTLSFVQLQKAFNPA